MVREFLSNDNASKDRNVLGVNYNGSVGEAFYHPYGAFSFSIRKATSAMLGVGRQ